MTGPLDWWHLGEALGVTVIVSFLTWYGVYIFQAYSMQDAKMQKSPSLLNPLPTGIWQMYGVENEGTRYIAVGSYQPNADGDTSAALWQSPDGGYSWNWMHYDDQLQGPIMLSNGQHAQRTMLGIASTGNGSLIVGKDNALDGVTRGRVWRLRAGVDTVEPADDIPLPTAYSFTGYGEHGSEAVLVGYTDHDAMVWHRDRNTAWAPISIGDSKITDVKSVYYQKGEWILTGNTKSTDPDYSPNLTDENNYWHNDAAIWTSKDGIHWLQAAGLSGVKGSQKISDVVYIQDQWLAVGEDDSGDPAEMDPAVWVSSDSHNWQRIDERALKIPGWQTMTGAAVSPDKRHVIVVGLERPRFHREGNEPAPPSTNQPTRSAAWEIDFAPRRGGKSPLEVFRELVEWVHSAD
ncbi:hypothetical protein [Mycobacterium paraense]|uniref:hypothetical protein n=1 Tax=Mycobacterium paraense TaxID=767916 RepID=UPI00111C2692|nr:hypothetical protein [Mycobacterium paraense]